MAIIEADFKQPSGDSDPDRLAAEAARENQRLPEDSRVIRVVGEEALWDTPSQPDFPPAPPYSISHRGFGSEGPHRPPNRGNPAASS